MTLIIQLPDEQGAALQTRAQSQGLSADRVCPARVGSRVGRRREGFRAILETFTQQMHALPDEVFEHLPTDGASEHDHYFRYGGPRRNQP